MQPTTLEQPRVPRATDRGEVLGGLLLMALTIAPTVVYGVVGSEQLGVRLATGAMQLLVLLLMALLAPLVGWRRRDIWWALLPIWAEVIAYRLGVGLVRRGRGEVVRERFPRL